MYLCRLVVVIGSSCIFLKSQPVSQHDLSYWDRGRDSRFVHELHVRSSRTLLHGVVSQLNVRHMGITMKFETGKLHALNSLGIGHLLLTITKVCSHNTCGLGIPTNPADTIVPARSQANYLYHFSQGCWQ